MAADTFTPTFAEDRGDCIYFRDVSSVAKIVPKDSELCGLYLRRLGSANTAELDGLKAGARPSPAQEVSTYETTVELSSAELLTLSTNPKTLIEAQGAHKKIQVISASLYLDYNATAYTDASLSELVLAYKDTAGAKIASIPLNALITATEDGNLDVLAMNGIVSEGDNASIWENQPLVAYLTSAITTGDSPIKLKLIYRVEETGL